LFFLASLPVQAGVIYIDSLADPGVPGDGQTTLREAIIAANADSATDSGGSGNGADIIDLSGVGGILKLSAPLPDVTTELEIVGQPLLAVTISGDNAHKFIANSGPGLRLAHLIFEDAYFCEAPFGAIRNSGTLLIEHCIIRGGRAALRTGVVNEAGGTLEIHSTLFEGNHATPVVHEILFGGNADRWLNAGAVLTNEGEALMADCAVRGNHAWRGGIIQNFAHLVVERCRFEENGGEHFRYNPETGAEPLDFAEPGIARGAVIQSGRSAFEPGSSLRVRDSHFERNPATAIEVYSPMLEISRSSFISNDVPLVAKASKGLISNSTFAGVSNRWRGGDLVPHGGDGGIGLSGRISVVNCTIAGRPLFVQPFPALDGSGMDMTAIHLANSIVNGLIVGNVVRRPTGGALDTAFSETPEGMYNVRDLRATFEESLAEAPNGTKYIPLRPCSPARGAGSIAALDHPDFPGALDTDQTGAPRTSGGLVDYGAHQAMGPCEPEPPASDAVCAPPNLATHKGLVVNSLADPGVPGDGLVTLREALMAFNFRTTTDLGQNAVSAAYIDMTCLTGRLVVSEHMPGIYRSATIRGPEDQSLVITSGHASLAGILGTGNNDEGPNGPATARFENLVFEDVITTGGVIVNAWPAGRVEFHRCRFERCTLVYNGFQAAYYDSSIIDCGHGLSVSNGFEFIRSAYRGNSGAIHSHGRAQVRLSVFDSNRDTPLRLGHEGTPALPSIIDRSLFAGNQGILAGALEASGFLTITNSTFSGNRCVGGEFAFQRHTLRSGGGAISVLPEQSSLEFGVPTVKLDHCTIVSNRSAYRGGGIYLAASTQGDMHRVELKNSIVAGNAARLGGPDIWGEIAADRFNVVGNPADVSGLGPSDRTGHAVDEIVLPLENNGGPHRTHAVLQCGPAFDFAMPLQSIGVDELGNPRSIGCGPDAGSFELAVDGCAPVDPALCPAVGPYPVPEYTGRYRGDEFLVWEGHCPFELPEDPEGAFEGEGWDGGFGGGDGEDEGESWQDRLLEGEYDFDAEAWMTTEENTDLLRHVIAHWLPLYRYGGEHIALDSPAVDLDGDARLSRMEAYESLEYLQRKPERIGGHRNATSYRTSLFDLLDIDGDEGIRLPELHYWATRLGALPALRDGDSPLHSADTNGDFRLGLSELLRVVQLFSIGGYGCGELAHFSDDGFQAHPDSPESTWCFGRDGFRHDSDIDADSVISLEELLRAVQLFNGAYLMRTADAPCGQSEDGFCDPGYWADFTNVFNFIPRADWGFRAVAR
jgi:hypothetical protein